MNKKLKILFIYPKFFSFIQRDLELLRKNFDVRVLQFTGKTSLPFCMPKMLKDTLWADLTFSWFADIHAFFAVLFSKVFRKKSIVVVGGYEVTKVPEIGYGLMSKPKYTHIMRYTLGKANKVLTVDDGLKTDAIKNVGVSGKNIQTVPLSFDYNEFKPKGKKENLAVTLSTGDSWGRARLKGVDTFVKSAKFFSDVKFLVIGIRGDALKKLQEIASSNVEFIYPSSQGDLYSLSQDDLISYYQKAKVYCQLSMREGHPNALCEAMLCECVPVGTDVQGVRTAIGDAGFYTPYGDAKATAEAIKGALNSNRGKGARERIKTMFSVQMREKELIDTINNLLR